MKKKNAYILTYGCQMNVYDSEKIKTILLKSDYKIKETCKECDLVILNTCHIREKATEKIYSELGRINKEKDRMLKQEGRYMIIIVAGCIAQAEQKKIFKRAKYVDIIIGPESYHNLYELIQKAENGERNLIDVEFDPKEKFDKLPEEDSPVLSGSSFITIQEGCNKFCTYCVVPYTRGREFSRKENEVMKEIYKNVELGAKEIVLLGQNVNAYHGIDDLGNESNLANLIKKIAQIDEVKRIRYTTSHPLEMTDDLIKLHGFEKKLMPMLNLPIQSGSDRILAKMNRKYKGNEYIDILTKLRSVRPDMVFSSDFIVGFPGETEEDFEETINLIKKVIFESQCFSFKYSPRPGTPASRNLDQVPEKIKSDRLKILQELLESQVKDFNQSMLGMEIEVLFDTKKTKEKNQIAGRSEYLQICILSLNENQKKEDFIGKIFKVKVAKINNNSLEVELI